VCEGESPLGGWGKDISKFGFATRKGKGGRTASKLHHMPLFWPTLGPGIYCLRHVLVRILGLGAFTLTMCSCVVGTSFAEVNSFPSMVVIDDKM
jgi:hypothetical protein